MFFQSTVTYGFYIFSVSAHQRWLVRCRPNIVQYFKTESQNQAVVHALIFFVFILRERVSLKIIHDTVYHTIYIYDTGSLCCFSIRRMHTKKTPQSARLRQNIQTARRQRHNNNYEKPLAHVRLEGRVFVIVL